MVTQMVTNSKKSIIFATRTLIRTVMIVVSTRDFRTNQTKYLKKASSGEHVILKSRTGSFKIIPISTDDIVSNKRDLATELRGALQEVKDHLEGKKQLQSLDSLLDEL